MTITGIYAIVVERKGKDDLIYIGQSVDIKRRWSKHKREIETGVHLYKELVLYNNLDPKNIKYEILERCSEEDLEQLERDYIRYFKMVDGIKVVNKTEYTKRKSKVKDTTKMEKAQKWQSNGNAKLTLNEAKEILYLKEYGYKAKDIAEMYDICSSYVYDIGRTKWVGLYDELEDKYIPKCDEVN